MNKLLVAFDGSENAVRALRYAIALAKEQKTLSLHVVHVHEAPLVYGELVYGELGLYISDQKLADLQRVHSERVLEGAEGVLKDAAVSYSKEILIGPLASTLAQRADELGCKGIVLGTRGMSAIGNLVMGSVATKVIHFANVPVTLAK